MPGWVHQQMTFMYESDGCSLLEDGQSLVILQHHMCTASVAQPKKGLSIELSFLSTQLRLCCTLPVLQVLQELHPGLLPPVLHDYPSRDPPQPGLCKLRRADSRWGCTVHSLNNHTMCRQSILCSVSLSTVLPKVSPCWNGASVAW